MAQSHIKQDTIGWYKWMPIIGAAWTEKVTANAFQMANLGSGDKVLEIAAGDGYYSVQAAQLVGDDGFVLATDISEDMVGRIIEVINKNQLSNVKAEVMNGENLTVDDASFDIVMCLFGLMLFPNPKKGLSEAYRVLKPGGRYLAIVFTAPERTPWLAIPARIALQHARPDLSFPHAPGLFALSSRGQVKQLLIDAKFRDIETRVITVPTKFKSAAECTSYIREVIGAVKIVVATLDEEKQEIAWQAIEDALKQLETENGFNAPTELLFIAGKK